jgi:hypothetical protein
MLWRTSWTKNRHRAIGTTWFQAGRKPIDAATITPQTTGQSVCGPLRTKRATNRLAPIEPTARRASNRPELSSA